jgi:flagellar motor switch protein FliN
VSAARNDIQSWLLGELASRFAAAFEMMTGERPEVECSESEQIEAATLTTALRWRQPFSGVSGAIWIAAAESDWIAAGGAVTKAAGMTEEDPAKLKSEYLEILNQAMAGAAQAMAARLEREVVSQGGEESASGAAEIVWAAIHVRQGELAANLAAGLEFALLDEFLRSAKPEISAAPEIEAAPEKASTFDLLFDVELPVSVSFGRAQVALKDVLKLTTGSIVELNRAIGDAVEVIVNNCVIARGEVVVVEGNFGVRIQQVISRQERLRTLT